MSVGDGNVANKADKPQPARGARRGEQILQRLRERPPTLWYQGEQIKDVTTHPALRGGVETLAKLYDLQWQKPAVSLFDSPTTGNKVGRSFLIPRTMEDLRSVTGAMRVWQDYTHGMMAGRRTTSIEPFPAMPPARPSWLRLSRDSARMLCGTTSTCARTIYASLIP